ncbi:hypothetical protein [Gordoniibacillus kamchatkensis]|nr:hypothetical protein [Paenibacillus sp. VKM B-2647]
MMQRLPFLPDGVFTFDPFIDIHRRNGHSAGSGSALSEPPVHRGKHVN